jgi:thiamine-phosphate diphosphorylase
VIVSAHPPARDAVRARARFGGLHVLCDDDPRWTLGLAEQARAACAGGAAVVQLRAKHAPDREALAHARALREITRAAGVCFVVNDRFDLALACEADGVHLGQTDLPPAALPRAARARLAIGRSTHTLDEARAARREPVDYVAYGPVYGTQSKQSEYDARGLETLAEVAAIVAPKPLVAIGGITREGLGPVLDAGATGAAVISAVIGAPDPVAATVELVARFGPGDAEGG